MLFVAPGRFLRYGPLGCCCYTAELEIVEIRARNGTRQYKPLCPRCRRVGGAVPHSALAEVERLRVRLLRDRVGEAACARCGRYDRGVEEHHWAPREFFGLESFKWPTSYLCSGCHDRWHTVINAARRRRPGGLLKVDATVLHAWDAPNLDGMAFEDAVAAVVRCFRANYDCPENYCDGGVDMDGGTVFLPLYDVEGDLAAIFALAPDDPIRIAAVEEIEDHLPEWVQEHSAEILENEYWEECRARMEAE